MFTNYVREGTSGGNLAVQLDASPVNPLGTVYAPPIATNVATTTKGYGSQPLLRYVQYNSTSNPAPVGVPAPVYWADETYTVVTPVQTEAQGSSATLGLNSIAGYLLINTTNYGSTLTATLLNTGYVWIQTGGFLAGANVIATGSAVGDAIIGVTGTNWVPGHIASGSNITLRTYGFQLAAAVAGVADIWLDCDYL